MTFDIEINTTPLVKFAERVGNIDEIVNREMQNTMRASLTAIEQTVINVIDEKNMVYNGHLRASIHQEIYGAPPDFVGSVNTGIIYGYQMEEGRPPGIMPPAAALDLWAKRKNIPIPGYVLARSIESKGIRGRHYMRDSFVRVKDRVEALWAGLVDRVIVKFEGGQ